MKETNFEKVQDTCIDIANYAIILKMVLDDEWAIDESLTAARFRSQIGSANLLFIAKLKDYGTQDFLETGVQGVLSRLIEKFSRLKNLLRDTPRSPKHTQNTSDATTGTFVASPATLLVKQLHPNGGQEICGMLAPKHEGDAGADLVVSEDTIVPPIGELPVSVPCGFSVKLPSGYWAEIRPRSSTSSKLGILVHQSCMDNGYLGQWFIVCHSLLGKNVEVKKGTRLAQCVLHPLHPPTIKQVPDLPNDTTRGIQGFGSTGLTV